MYNTIGRFGLGSVLTIIVLAGCIQPTHEGTITATAPAGAVSVPVQPAAGGVPSWPMIEQFIRDRGNTPNNLQVWYEQPRDPDRLQGFSYSSANGSPCVGFLLTALTNGVWQPSYGAQICAPQPDGQALAGVTFFPTSDGAVYTIVFGRVADPSISAVAVMYADGSNQTVNPFMGGFLLVKAGVHSATTITAVNAEGYTVIANIPQTPV